MRTSTQKRERGQRGVALVLAIFTLMLISVVGTALILMAGTETAIKSNYKSAMHAFYDAKAGLEEGRGRLWINSANSIYNCAFPTPGVPMPKDNVCYIVNNSAGEVVNPLDLSPGNPYADNQYNQEFGTPITNANVQQPFITSTSAVGGIAGPLYKWVRITPRTEASAGIDVDGDGTIDASNPLFYDGTQQVVGPGTGTQVLTVTALSATPAGTRRIVEYAVAQGSVASAMPNFPAALTLDGNGVSSQTRFTINGNDMNAPSGTQVGVPGIGYTNSSDSSAIVSPNGTVLSPPGIPPITQVSMPPAFQTPASLDLLVQAITASADAVITGPATQSGSNNIMPTGMSATTPMIVVVNGDLTFSSWRGTGYGLLLVTGNLKYDPDASWDGIILVIGKGTFLANQNGNGQINGAVVVANTRDSAGNLLTTLGPASFRQSGGGNGIYYSSAWIQATQNMIPYQVLSFREWPQIP